MKTSNRSVFQRFVDPEQSKFENRSGKFSGSKNLRRISIANFRFPKFSISRFFDFRRFSIDIKFPRFSKKSPNFFDPKNFRIDFQISIAPDLQIRFSRRRRTYIRVPKTDLGYLDFLVSAVIQILVNLEDFQKFLNFP